ncbi:armadillo repeat-containing protein 2 isoform X2 [Sitophilus oryzae]|uniref:Armadillo repeat-containing protein 2 isoform X2 n=1 Tax=Sitophilus oryzae TaxID=7048 RepID=A0A6J2XAK2_SITOR|nr:armadillo repeat-containing protein 2 isoform X2 [Sitophilus oryzae]
MEFKKVELKNREIQNFPGNNEGIQRKTSAEIINEARLAIKESQNPEKNYASPTIKPLQTQRPFTPRNKERHLFGSSRPKADRPPSSFSLKYLQNETDLPVTPPDDIQAASEKNGKYLKHVRIKKHNRSSSLSEITENIFNITTKEPRKVKLPSLDSVKPLQKRKLFANTSLDNLPEETEPALEKPIVESRKAFSSPQERTNFESDSDSSVFGRPSIRHSNLSECLLLGPQNLSKIFENKQIVEHSESLFTQTAEADQKRTVEMVLSELNRVDAQKYDEDVVRRLLEELYDVMEQDDLIGNKISSKLKIVILKNLYRFVESKNEDILINIAQVILAIKVTGNNLSGVCKLVFKISKNDKNDHLFFRKNFLELFLDALGRSSPIDDAEACVYGYGSIKFLTMNSKLMEKILDLGILPLMVLHIKLINNAKIDKTPMPQQTNHVMFQLTGALRNLVSEDRIYDNFISSGAVVQLCQTLNEFSNDVDIVTNISRTLSTISTNEVCCDSLDEISHLYKTFIKLFALYTENEEIIVRLTYTLGNIVAKLDNTRVKYFKEENSIDSLLHLWSTYLEKTLHICALKQENSIFSASNSEDVMIKVIRVIANIVINPDIGKAINEQYGNKLIEEFLKVLISNPFKKNEELVLSILSTLNNLSYYYSSDLELDIFHVKQIDIAEGILEYTRSKNNECIIETMRILGNLSRSKITRSYIAETDLFDVLLNILNTDEMTLLKTTTGVFVNVLSENRSRTIFKNKGGVQKLINILKKYCEDDWLLGSLVCQVLWNYCIDTLDLYELLTDSEINQLLILLADYLDEEKLFGVDENIEEVEVYVTQEYLMWEEFANVATNLLEKIEYFLDTFDQIQIPEDQNPKKPTRDSNTNISFAAW